MPERQLRELCKPPVDRRVDEGRRPLDIGSSGVVGEAPWDRARVQIGAGGQARPGVAIATYASLKSAPQASTIRRVATAASANSPCRRATSSTAAMTERTAFSRASPGAVNRSGPPR